jgi:hypothetical protein
LAFNRKGRGAKWGGISTALNIAFHQVENPGNVKIGAGRWIDKATAGTVACFILLPLAGTAGIGAWQQMKMPERVFEPVARSLSPAARRTDNA